MGYMTATGDIRAILDHTERDVKEIIRVAQTPYFSYVSDVLTHLHRLLAEVVNDRVNSSGALICYRALVSTMVNDGYWYESDGNNRLNEYREMLLALESQSVGQRKIHVMTPYELRQSRTPRFVDGTLSPLAAASFQFLDPDKVSLDAALTRILMLMTNAQNQYWTAEQLRNKSTRKSDRAIMNNHSLMGHLVSNSLLSPKLALTVNFALEQRYINRLLSQPDTDAGRARIIELLMLVVDTNHYQYFNTHELVELVDNEDHALMPISLVYQMSVANQGNRLAPKSHQAPAHRFLTDDVWKD